MLIAISTVSIKSQSKLIKPKRTLQDALIRIEEKSAYWQDFLDQKCAQELLKATKNGLIALYDETPTIEVDAELRSLMRAAQIKKTPILPELEGLSNRALEELKFSTGWSETIYASRKTIGEDELREFVKSLLIKSTIIRNPQKDKNWIRENRRKYFFRFPQKSGRPPVYSYELRFFINSLYINYLHYCYKTKPEKIALILDDKEFLYIVQDCIEAIGIDDETSEKQLVKITFSSQM